jgi:hypothetical protein
VTLDVSNLDVRPANDVLILMSTTSPRKSRALAVWSTVGLADIRRRLYFG